MRILFVCTANSCRSQMAEAWARDLFPEHWQVSSAGLLTYPISRRTKAVMDEVGLDLSNHHSKSIEEVDLESFDMVVTLSKEAEQYLPELRDGAEHRRRAFRDPMGATGNPEEVRRAFREGRQKALDIVQEVISDHQEA